MDSHYVVESGEPIVKEALRAEQKGLNPKSITLAFLIFAFLGYSHDYSLHTILVAAAVFSGVVAIRLTWWNLTHSENFNAYGSLLFETALYPVEYYALGWLLRLVFDYFEWSIV
ncbi:hypothetical protein [Rhizobium leguminosarum]|jgi:uncharacterized membrane protein|uniref:Uncharacterized protein n=1 Tax=Rhizobium leguminosarum TaxID=384 RepID=A0ABD7PPZ5_RHILE|nr:hypothetical protein [Rhizobium leguminosarum]TAV73176.1 hypothetical protein ELI28_06490 [Rhizobium leguminosarum]TAV77776.1 hypothetical protein ELI27_06490 [Rhizobium leguminosarum]TAW29155.1 hypothetical protein ELI19_06465 [Rhizobium leguminosarum]TAW42883.1 hypothetical protein ELI18_06405 [Rhizobium leguminosarum]TAX33975.1 hypothetical protein ELI06_06425 [Rhizobium leguminosarum]